MRQLFALSIRPRLLPALTAVLSALVSTWAAPDLFSAPAQMKIAHELRVIAYNLFLGDFWPKDAPLAVQARKQGQFAERLALELALHQPDIITFSEAPEEAVVKDVARRLGMNHVFFSTPTRFPGALLTRFEIIDSRDVPLVHGERATDLFTRHWGKATVRLPDDSPLIVHSAHLYPRASETNVRMREIRAMHQSILPDLEAGRSVLLTGDLNYRPDWPEHQYLLERGWVDTFIEAGVGTGMTARPGEPTRRIDYILAAGPIANRIVEARSLHEGAFRHHSADPASFALSDHLPVFALFNLKDASR